MKTSLLLLCSLTFFAVAHASEEQLRQLTESEVISDHQLPYDDALSSYGTRALKVASSYCEEGQRLRRMPNPDYPAIIKIEEICNQSVYIDNAENVVGFEFNNTTLNRVNPRTAEFGSERTYRFQYPLRHSQNINISITENSGLTSLMSHDLLESTIVLLPRKVIPSMVVVDKGEQSLRRIQLPTAETIDIDARTGEIVAGVLLESPMDMTESRHSRRFAGLTYTGRGLMIRVDRRAGTPEHIYSVAFNQNERIKEATVTYRGKTCYVPKQLIWANATNPDLGAYVLYASDQELLDKAINPKCGWKLTVKDLE